ncbi:MAG: glycosyltransferase family 2 protein [Candidatus Riflebacteria bacterium]|nr:glycosyltransferase family 2 protein [Candidatus Riflebacteria bacterium]
MKYHSTMTAKNDQNGIAYPVDMCFDKCALPPQVTAVVVGYRSIRFLRQCFTALMNQQDVSCEIVFIDNNSHDGSVDLVRNEFPAIRVLERLSNDGYAVANNQGIAEARRCGAKYVFILNPDVILEKDCLKLLLREASEKTGLFQPLLLLPDGRIQSAGNRVHYLGFGCSGLRNCSEDGNTAFRVNYASGAALLIDIAIIEQIGDIEESFFLYHEDLEFGLRAQLAGFYSWCVPAARALHDHSFDRNPNKIFYLERNRLAFLFAYASPKTLLRLAPLLICVEIAVIIFACLLGPKGIRAKLTSFVSLIGMRRDIKKLRKRVMRFHPDPYAFLFPTFYGEIDFPPDAGFFPGFANVCSRNLFRLARYFVESAGV